MQGNTFYTELLRDISNDLGFVSSEGQDQPGHSASLIKLFTVLVKKAKVLSYPFSA